MEQQTTEMERNNPGIILLASSSDGGLLDVRQDNCTSIFGKAGSQGSPIPGICIVSLIVEPGRNTSSLMRRILNHLQTETSQSDSSTSPEVLENLFITALNDFKAQNSNCPMLITWSDPFFIDKRAADSIPVYILDIIGDFPKGLKDPNFIALAGLALTMCSSAVTVLKRQLQVESIQNIAPLVVQGLRSTQLKHYKQLHIIILDVEAGPWGSQQESQQLLRQFWSDQVDNSIISRFRTIFKTFHCHNIPATVNPFSKPFFTKCLRVILDTTIDVKCFDNGNPMLPEDILNCMERHASDVTDADFEEAFRNFVVTGVLEETPEQKDDKFKKPRQNSITADDSDKYNQSYHADLTEEDDKIDQQPTEDDMDVQDLTQMLSQCNIQTECDLSKQVKPKRKREKFSQLFKSRMTEDIPLIPIEPNKILTEPSETVNNAETEIDNISGSSNFEPRDHRNHNQLENPQVKCLTKSKVKITDYPEEMAAKQQISKSYPILGTKCDDKAEKKSKQIVEIKKPPPPEEYNHNNLERIQHAAIEIFDSVSANSTMSAKSLVHEAVQKMSKDPSGLDVTNRILPIIETLMTAVVEFQNHVEQDFSEMTGQELGKKVNEAHNKFLPEKYKPLLKRKLDELAQIYTKRMIDNREALEDVTKQSINHLSTLVTSEVTNCMAKTGPVLWQSAKHRVKTETSKKAEGTLIKYLAGVIPSNKITEIQARLDDVIAKEMDAIEKKWIDENSEMALAKLEYINYYRQQIADKESSILTMGCFEVTHNGIQDKLTVSFGNRFEKYALVSTHKADLAKRLESLFKELSAGFLAKIRSCQSSPLVAFASPTCSLQSNSVMDNNSISETSIGIHFGLLKLGMNYWDNSISTSKSVLENRDNTLSYYARRFKLGGRENFVDCGQVFVNPETKLHLWLLDFDLTGASLILIMLANLKIIAESEILKKASNFVLSIPSFIDETSYNGITQFGSLINAFIDSVITETDAVAIQYFGNVGLSESLQCVARSAVIVVVRKNSYDIACYSVEHGQIIRYYLASVDKSKGRIRKAVGYVKSWLVDEFVKTLKTVVSNLPKSCLRGFKTIVTSDNPDIVGPDFFTKINSNVPLHAKDIQLLSTCAAKGASFLAAFRSGDRTAKKHWCDAYSDYSQQDWPSILITAGTPTKGVVKGWWATTSDEETIKIKSELEFAYDNMSKKQRDIKKEFREFLQLMNREIENKQELNPSPFIKNMLATFLENYSNLITVLDVNEKCCQSFKQEISAEFKKYKASM